MQEKVQRLIALGLPEKDATIFVRANGCCEYCGIDLISERLAFDCVQFDHIIPKSKQGSDDLENMAFSCRLCNTAKHTLFPTGNNRAELIESAKGHLREKRKHADGFWASVKGVLRA